MKHIQIPLSVLLLFLTNPGSHVVYCYHVSFSSFNLEQILILLNFVYEWFCWFAFWLSWQIFLRNTGQVLCKMSLCLTLSDVSLIRFRSCILGKNTLGMLCLSQCTMTYRYYESNPGYTAIKKETQETQEMGVPFPGREDPWEGNGNPLQHSCPENSMDRGAWWAVVHGVARSWT